MQRFLYRTVSEALSRIDHISYRMRLLWCSLSACHKNYICSGDAFTCKASPLPKQSPGLFWNSPLAKRFGDICGALPHTPPEALPLDSAKGAKAPLESQPFGFNDETTIFERLIQDAAALLHPVFYTFIIFYLYYPMKYVIIKSSYYNK